MDPITNVEELSPERIEAINQVKEARFLIAKDDYESAKESLNKAEGFDPMYIEIYKERGNMAVLQDQPELAMEHYGKALEIDKNNAELHYQIGNLKVLTGAYAEAIEEYRTAENLGYADAFLSNNLGYAYEQEEQMDEAMVCYLRASRENPEWAEPVMHRIDVCNTVGRTEEAEELCKDAIMRFPAELTAYKLMVDILIEKKDLDEAENFLKVADEVFEDEPELKLQWIRVYMLTDRYDEARTIFEKLQGQVDPANTEAMNGLDQLHAEMLMSEEKVEEAIECFRAIIGRENGKVNVEARTSLFNMYALMKRYTDMLDLANDTLNYPEADGELCMAYAYQPLALEQLGRMEEAIPLYREALKKLRLLTIQDVSRNDARVFRVMCLMGLKEYDQALEELAFCEKVLGEDEMLQALKATILRNKGDIAAAEKIEAKIRSND